MKKKIITLISALLTIVIALILFLSQKREKRIINEIVLPPVSEGLTERKQVNKFIPTKNITTKTKNTTRIINDPVPSYDMTKQKYCPEVIKNPGDRLFHDAKGQVISKTDSDGKITRYKYVDGRLVIEIKPSNTNLYYTYGEHGNLIDKKDSGEKWLYKYKDGRLNAIHTPDGTSTIINYTATGEFEYVIFPDGSLKKASNLPHDYVVNLFKDSLRN